MDDSNKDLSKYRLEKADSCLDSAKVLLESGDYCGAANRSYFAIFHCIRAVLALEGVDFSKHSGVLAHFRKHYVKTGIFSREYSKIITQAFDTRSDADYDDYYLISKKEVIKQIENAEFFRNGIYEYVTNVLNETPINREEEKQLEPSEEKKPSTGRKL